MYPGQRRPAEHLQGRGRVHALIVAGIILFLGLALASCATQSVRHLKQQPWSLDEPQSMRTNYLRFDFVCNQGLDGLRVQGSAYPLSDGPIPEWAVWARDLWLGVYLSDRSGQVLAQEVKVLSPQNLTSAHPISFTFVLEPHSMGEPGPVYISFGYRLVLASGPTDRPEENGQGPGAKSPVFFASESALTRF
ncbi:MAG: hypothetical protein KGY41_01980 [Desulfovermiculus sp.]|nr:hypothetical protein [Desulfovermiculus sp.]